MNNSIKELYKIITILIIIVLVTIIIGITVENKVIRSRYDIVQIEKMKLINENNTLIEIINHNEE